jgi:hypothetical protein
MPQHNSQNQPTRQQIIGDIQISGNKNVFNNVQGDNNILHFFSYEITPYGGVVNILPPEQAPRVTALPTPIELRPKFFPDLLGRKTEMEQIIAALEASQTIELYGAAGVGKSVLLRHLAHHSITKSQQLFPDGVIYFHLRRQEPVEDMQQRLFDAFYKSEPYFKPSTVRVRQDLQNKRTLVILDNSSFSRKDIEKLWEIAPNCVYVFSSVERHLWEGQPIQVGGISQDGALALIERELGRSLTDREQIAAEALCTSLNGCPLEILQQLAGVYENKECLANVAGRVQKNTSPKARIEQLLKPLSQPQRAVLAALAALGGIALTANQASAIAEVQGTKANLDILEKIHLVQQEGSCYSLSTNLLISVRQMENLTPYLERAVSFFTKWAQQATPEELKQESEAVSHLLQWSVEQGRWNDVLMLGKPFESALALSGQWELQDRVLQWYQQAAENSGNKTAIAWAAHEMGVRSFCLGESFRARNLLSKAFKLREELGDSRGAELTQHHLNLKIPTAPPIPEPSDPSPPQPSPWTEILKKALVPALVTGGLIGLGTRLLPTGTNSSLQTPLTTSPSTSSSQQTPVPSCVAANVEKKLSVYSQPDSNSQLAAYLSAREPATTTAIRQGNFVEISTPVRGWIDETNVLPCDSSPDKFGKAPILIKDPSIPKCVTADVETALNIRSEPYLNAKIVRKISPREPAKTTGMRQGTFIKISEPDKGWINEAYIVRCDTTATPTPSPNDSPTPTPSPNDSPTPTPSPNDNPTPTPSPNDNPTPTPSPNDNPTPTPSPNDSSTPKKQTGKFEGTWVGKTEQGYDISFQVVPSSNGESVINLLVSFNFENSCPIGRITFSSLQDAYIWEPANSFKFLSLTERSATAFVKGAFTSHLTASGKLEVVDTRDPSEKSNSPCSFNNVVSWSASKQ